MRIRYLFTDLDNTLLDSRKNVSRQTMDLIAFIRKSYGVRFGVATGRDSASVVPLLKRTGLDGITDAAVVNNGVETILRSTGERIELPRISREKIQEILRLYQGVPGLKICFHSGDTLFSTVTDERSRNIARLNGRTRIANPLEDDSYLPAPRVMLVFAPGDYPRIRAFSDAHPVAGLCPCLSEPDVYEFVEETVSKSRGIGAYVARFHHSLSDVLVFGDSNNDIDMLQKCGLGVAMKNGTPEALAAADEVSAETCDDDGVYRYLKSHLSLFVPDGDVSEGKETR